MGRYVDDNIVRFGVPIWTPNLNPNFIDDRAFTLYAMEQSGDLPTRRGKINNIINLMVAAGPECNNFEVQCAIYDTVGFDSDTLTNQEVKYIEEEVAKRLWDMFQPV